MKYLQILIFCLAMINHFGCKPISTIINWTESQTLCVYWSQQFESRDTLSAINFVLKSKSKNVLTESEFKFLSGESTFDLIKTRLFASENHYVLGLKLQCEDLYLFYLDDEYQDDGPCYEDKLNQMVNSGRLINEMTNLEIRKSDTFKNYRGLK